MNYLFTLKARIIVFALLACSIAAKAQSASDTVKSSTLAMVLDTPLNKKSNNTQLIKSDTTLVIKAGAKLVHRADTTLVIDPDGTLAKKFNDMVAEQQKADQAKKSAAKTDSALLNPSTTTQQQSSNAKNTVTPPATTTVPTAPVIATPVPTTDSSLPASQQSAGNQQPAATQPQSTQQQSTQQQNTQPQNAQQQVAPPVVNQDNSAKQAVTTAQQAVKKDSTQQTGNGGAPSTNALSVKADTVALKKTDTLAAKKADTTLSKKSDTTKFAADTTQQTIKAQNVYLELGGPGLAISANYDTRFHKERNGWGYRVGVGFFSSGGNTVFTVPFQVNYLIGEHALMLELGAGTTFLNSTGTNVGNSKWEFDKITGFIATATIGFRYQPEQKGLNFRIGFVPILYDEGIIPAGGISVGYTFK